MLKDIPDLTRSVLVDSDLQAQPDPDPTQSAGTLHAFHLTPNEVSIKYAANLPGLLTVVDSFSDGWHAEVNGKEVSVLRVDGVFRGVRIETSGEVEVRFWYRPPRWNLSVALVALGLLLLFLPFFARRRRRIPRGNSNDNLDLSSAAPRRESPKLGSPGPTYPLALGVNQSVLDWRRIP